MLRTQIAFTGADLRDATFNSASLYAADGGAFHFNGNVETTDLRGADFTSASLIAKGQNSLINFESASLQGKGGGVWPGAKFTSAWLEAASYAYMDFNAAWLEEANFESASLITSTSSTFSFGTGKKKGDLEAADFTSAYLYTSGPGSELNFDEVDLQRATFTGASLSTKYNGLTDFTGADLEDASFTSAWLEAASYGYLYFIEADLRGANFESASLRADDGGKLSFRNPPDAKGGGKGKGKGFLQDADFTSADLRADYGSMEFQNARLQRATFTDASLTAINRGGIDFAEADFDDASFTSAYLDTKSYGSISFNAAEIRGASFKDASLYARYGSGDFSPSGEPGVGEIILGQDVVPELDEKEETDFTGATVVSEAGAEASGGGVVGCVINPCSTHGSFDGTYHCEPDFVSSTDMCDAQYCDKYLAENDQGFPGELHDRCSAPVGSGERCLAEVECVNTCLTGLPSCY